MDEMTSTEFRKHYASVTTPTVVTAAGRPIGQWIPVGYSLTVTASEDGSLTIDPPPMKGQRIETTYPYQPGSLKVGGAGFSTRPFTPVPKR